MTSRLAPWQSLRTRATAFTLLVFVLGIWAMSAYVSSGMQANLERLLGEQQLSVATAMAQQVDREMTTRMQALRTIAKEMDAELLRSPSAVQAFLEQRPLLPLLFNGGAWVAGLDGTAMAEMPSSANHVGINFMGRDYMLAALKEGKEAIGKPVMGGALKAPAFAMAVPVRDAQGKVIGALVGVTNLGEISFLDNLRLNPYGKTGGYLLIHRQSRQIITATDPKRIMEVLPARGIHRFVDRNIAGYEGYGLLVNALGEEQLASVKQLPAWGWYILLGLPTAEALAPMQELQQNLLQATLLFALFTGAIIWWALRRQLAPLVVTAEAMVSLADTKQNPAPLPERQPGEIGQLVAAFNKIVQTWTQREAALTDSQQNLAITLNSIGDAVIATDATGLIVRMNPTAERLTGWALAESVGRPSSEVLHLINAETREAVTDPIQRVITLGQPVGLAAPTILRDKGGQECQIADSAAPIRDADGQVVGVVLVFSDVSEKYHIEKSLRHRQIMMERTENMAHLASFELDIDANITTWSPEMFHIFGRDPALGSPNLQGQAELFTPQSAQKLLDAVDKVVSDGTPYELELMTLQPDGEQRACLVKGFPERDDSGRVVRLTGLVQDITERKEYENQLKYLAHFDALTKLPNRVLSADRLQQAMAQEKRCGRQLAVVYLDLDGFKAINDRHGHATGDQVLITVSKRMMETLRKGDTLARLGGDEFMIVLVGLEDTSASAPLLNRLLAAVAEPVQVGVLSLQVSASLGVTFYPQAQDIEPDQLLRQADQAMYHAKLAGKNRYQIFDAAQDSHVRFQHESLARIRLALALREFVLHYQPQVNMRNGKIIGAEALIRWQHPDKGLLAPAVFLPVIEDHSLAVDVGEWVIDTALTQIELWHAAGIDLPVSVNIGARQLQQNDFVARLQAILANHPHVDPTYLELEVLETSALADIAQVGQVIDDCAKIGVMFALDDFGTGYSSLTYLKRLRVARIKIDQSFVRDMLKDPDDLAILQGVIGLAAAFKREVIAEGVETVAHGTLLLQLGCELAQGYGIARPMPPEQMPAWAAAWQPDAAWCALR
ncbi:EAL domain-containing protein [Massilia sp. DJPM01]|uniref:EAL domain-containing protein n=1 Tax=Massilia sp. DJPM01 TaxID=3024404 RepID=UPI00259EE55B|nr:EAL domain-containing protein [Massilia sp. DJPM01]MDM5178401.1 EAL domain-containing protein [Massilia sp. DJPM01]